MDDRVLADLGPDERKLLAIFARYGRDARAITTASLTAHAGFGLDRKRLSEALRKLAGKSARAGPQTGKRGIDNVAMPPQRGATPDSSDALWAIPALRP